MTLTINFISDLLASAVIEADDATAKYADAQKHLSQAKAAKYEEFETDDGRNVMKPISAIMAEIEAETVIPDAALPNGRSTKDERQAASRAWLLKNHALYAEYQRQLDDADFRTQMLTATVAVAEQSAKAANAKVSAAAAFAAYLTAQMENDTERLKLAGVKASTPMSEDTERGRQHDVDNEIRATQEFWERHPNVTRQPQESDDNLF